MGNVYHFLFTILYYGVFKEVTESPTGDPRAAKSTRSPRRKKILNRFVIYGLPVTFKGKLEILGFWSVFQLLGHPLGFL